MCEFFKRNCLGLEMFLSLTQSLLGFAARSYGGFSPWQWNPGLGGAWCGAGTPCSQDMAPEFLSTTHGCAPPICLDGGGFFNYVVIRFLFNLISDSSE